MDHLDSAADAYQNPNIFASTNSPFYVTEAEYFENYYSKSKLPDADGPFDLSAVPFLVYQRFIQLLRPAANYYFKLTSKHSYYHSFNLRGIETGFFTTDIGSVESGYFDIWNGLQRFSLERVRKDWVIYLNVKNHLDASQHTVAESLQFNKNYKKLSVDKSEKELADDIRALIHINLEELNIQSECITFPKFLDVLKSFDVCKKLKTFRFSIEQFSGNVKIPFHVFRREVEHCYQRHSGIMEICLLKVHFLPFLIHNGELRQIQKIGHCGWDLWYAESTDELTFRGQYF